MKTINQYTESYIKNIFGSNVKESKEIIKKAKCNMQKAESALQKAYKYLNKMEGANL